MFSGSLLFTLPSRSTYTALTFTRRHWVLCDSFKHSCATLFTTMHYPHYEFIKAKLNLMENLRRNLKMYVFSMQFSEDATDTPQKTCSCYYSKVWLHSWLKTNGCHTICKRKACINFFLTHKYALLASSVLYKIPLKYYSLRFFVWTKENLVISMIISEC